MRWLVEEQDGRPVPRRLAGIDLGIASRHSVRVLEADGTAAGRSSCVPTVESLSAVGQAAEGPWGPNRGPLDLTLTCLADHGDDHWSTQGTRRRLP
jgi:hypothetical protein